MLEKMKDCMLDLKNKNQKVSQIVQTLPNWDWSHYRGPLQTTPNHVKYYQITPYGK